MAHNPFPLLGKGHPPIDNTEPIESPPIVLSPDGVSNNKLSLSTEKDGTTVDESPRKNLQKMSSRLIFASESRIGSRS